MASNLISRSDLLTRMCQENCGERQCVDAMDRCVWYNYIKQQPAVDRWIPCSERLPEDESIPFWTTHEDGSIVMHWYSKECGFTFNWEVNDLEKRKRQGRVIAWMPILQPEPYKAGDIDG